MKNRNIALCIVFSIITCGIYAIYWSYRLVLESDEMLQNTGSMSPIVVVLLGYITAGIYWWIWMYQTGKKLDERNGGGNNAVLYIVLALLGLLIVDMALLQNEINKNAPA